MSIELKFAEKIRKKREEFGFSQSKFANLIGVSVTTIQNYEAGKIPKGSYLIPIAQHLECSIDWLLGNEKNETEDQFQNNGDMGIEDEEKTDLIIRIDEDNIKIPQWEKVNPPDAYHYVPMAEALLNDADGGSFILSEDITGRYYAFRKKFLEWIASSPKNVILMKVTGNSMEPKIEDGDTVMIDVGRCLVRNGCIYALEYSNTIAIKELEMMPQEMVRVISINTGSYPAYETGINEIRILGQVIWIDRIFVK